MTSATPRWSVVAPQGTNLELAGTDSREGWRLLLETARTVRRQGRGGLWLLDRTDTLPRREPEPVWEGWTALAALAGAVPGLDLGLLSSAPPFRNAALIAKRAAALDIVCDGRLTLGFSAREYLPEHHSTGHAVPAGLEPDEEEAAAHRSLGETAEALRALWSGQPVTFTGEHIRLTSAHCVPTPRQRPLPLALRAPAGDAGRGALLPADATVRECAHIQWTGEPGQVAAAVTAFRRRRTELGLDPDGVRHAWAAECRIFDSALDRDRWLATPHEVLFWSHHPDLLARRSLYGTPEQLVERARRLVAAGVAEFVLWFRDYPATTSLERLFHEVVPQVAPGAAKAAEE
ncbi:LLM class flavin-dependent oxidoreductase [Streptomyces sp. NPDC020379]|uniref:LLM class flavin-dependent oxidoreductase n=1 Tax=Streptomyces sp. NPDC020379 TaxID=3365071 RepID=UPI00379455B6